MLDGCITIMIMMKIMITWNTSLTLWHLYPLNGTDENCLSSTIPWQITGIFIISMSRDQLIQVCFICLDYKILSRYCRSKIFINFLLVNMTGELSISTYTQTNKNDNENQTLVEMHILHSIYFLYSAQQHLYQKTIYIDISSLK